MSTQFEKVVAVVSKPPDLRQEFEIQSLLPFLRKKSQLFAKLKTEYLKDIVRNCSIVTFVKDDIIIKQGDRGDCFYIILQGKISIFIINKDTAEDGDEKSAFDQIGTLTKEGALDRTKLGNYVCSLPAGIPFGEVALMSEDCIRTATIISEERTDLLMVDRGLYNRCVKEVLAKEFEEKTTFITTTPLFSNWAPKYRKQLAMAMYKESFPYESVMIRQGDPTANLYFVINGQVEIQTDPSSHSWQYPKIFRDAESEGEKLRKKAERLRPPTEMQYSQQKIKKQDNSKNLKLWFLGFNEGVGEQEFLLEMPTYMQTAVCTEKTDVLVLEMKHYERLFVKRHQRTIDAMRQMLLIKMETRMSMLSSRERAEVPLLGHLQKKLQCMLSPSSSSSDKKRKGVVSAAQAERAFLNHKGPLLDNNGPGSVFYMIRLRERTKEKQNARLKNRMNAKQSSQPIGHVHAIRLPQTLLMAAQMAGATKEVEVLMEKNDHHKSQKATSGIRAQSAKSRHRKPMSFRRIQSASKAKVSGDETDGENSQDNETGKVRSKSLPNSRPQTVTFEDDEDDASLSLLEAKVREWLCRDNPKRGSQVTQLRRLPLDEMDVKPKPGNKVVIRKRHRSSASNTTGSATGDGSEGDVNDNETETQSLDHLKILLAQ